MPNYQTLVCMCVIYQSIILKDNAHITYICHSLSIQHEMSFFLLDKKDNCIYQAL